MGYPSERPRAASRGRRVPVLAAGALLLVAGCGPGGPAAADRPEPARAAPAGPVSVRAGAPLSSAPSARVARRPSKLLAIVLENRAAADVGREMPGLTAQAKRYGQATRYFGVTHPSLPNYLTMAGGSSFRVRDDRGPRAHRLRGASVFGQALAKHKSARTYAEGMTVNCQQRDTGRYAVRHNPWTYFPDERAACRRSDVPAGTPNRGALQRDVTRGLLPTFALLVPDVCHDAHDCSLRTADRWLGSWLKKVQAGPDWRAGRLVVVVTFDEDDHSDGNHVAAVVMHPSLHGKRVRQRQDHRDLSAAASRLVGASPLRDAARRRGLLASFGLA